MEDAKRKKKERENVDGLDLQGIDGLHILNDRVQWPPLLRSRWFVCSATCGCHDDLAVEDNDKEPGTLEAVGPNDTQGRLRTCDEHGVEDRALEPTGS